MRSLIICITLTSAALLASASCTRMGYIHLTFYGYPDNSPPSGDTAYNCGGRNNLAGGTGTYNDPVTLASAEGEFNQCEVVYIPYIEKYARYEDYCAECTLDYASNTRDIRVWAGSSQASLNSGADQMACEAILNPNRTITIIRKPDSTYPVDVTPFYERGNSEALNATPSSPSTAPVPSESGGGGSEGVIGNGTTIVVNVTVNINVNVGGGRRSGKKIRRTLERSCTGNMYPENDATKICTT